MTQALSFDSQRVESARQAEPHRRLRDSFHEPPTDEILAATAHELRLPLSHIKGLVTSLRRTDVEWDDNTRREFIEEIDLETDRLAQVVESLLTTSTPDGGCSVTEHCQ